jgi:endonuclease/exonuclease/phosphatase family metal-dependent hydrolase
VQVLVWNLFHGRAVPNAGRSLVNEFCAALDGWQWDVALLQEVPPWWPPVLARATGAEYRHVLTSRNWLLPLRRAVASRNPDLLGSWGGGSNVILARSPIREHRTARLAWLPERRWMHGVALEGGPWVVNLHLTTDPKVRTRAEAAEVLRRSLAWAAGGALVIGGDFNLVRPQMPGLVHAGSLHVDHVFTAAIGGSPEARILDAGALSDHRPLLVRL